MPKHRNKLESISSYLLIFIIYVFTEAILTAVDAGKMLTLETEIISIRSILAGAVLGLCIAVINSYEVLFNRKNHMLIKCFACVFWIFTAYNMVPIIKTIAIEKSFEFSFLPSMDDGKIVFYTPLWVLIIPALFFIDDFLRFCGPLEGMKPRRNLISYYQDLIDFSNDDIEFDDSYYNRAYFTTKNVNKKEKFHE